MKSGHFLGGLESKGVGNLWVRLLTHAEMRRFLLLPGALGPSDLHTLTDVTSLMMLWFKKFIHSHKRLEALYSKGKAEILEHDSQLWMDPVANSLTAQVV